MAGLWAGPPAGGGQVHEPRLPLRPCGLAAARWRG